MGIELQILHAIQQIRTPWLDQIMVFVTKTGDVGILWLILGLLLLAGKRTRRCGLAMLAALVLDFLICNVGLKHLIGRIRPCEINQTIQLLIPRPTDFSFPSGHTTAAFTGATVLFASGYKKGGWLALFWACCIAFSRMYLYVHYPTDILGGILTGCVIGYGTVQAMKGLTAAIKGHRKELIV